MSKQEMTAPKPGWTPGPWRIVQYTNYEGFSIASEAEPEFGCIAERWEKIPGDGRSEARKFNARLIAAAPELAEALQILLVQFGEYQDGQGAAKYHAVRIAESALAKALGS